MKLKLTFVAVAAVLVSDAALAQNSPADPGSKIECRREQTTGTRLPRKKICAPKRVWDQVREENLEANAQRKSEAERSKPYELPR